VKISVDFTSPGGQRYLDTLEEHREVCRSKPVGSTFQQKVKI